jgi:NAD(P)-dependent dehydrogenase (short-subunit alcohol dehydrogenase family)
MTQASPHPPVYALKGKWCLVTGASRGIGSHISLGLARLGSNLVLHSRELSHTAALAEQIKALGVQVVTVAGELSDQRQVDDMLDAALAQAGQIDVVYNNAAIMTPYRPNIYEVSAEDFRTSFEVNVISLARICYRLLPPMMARQSGRIINLTSGIQEEPELLAYSISKAAVDKIARDFVRKLAGSGVQMNQLDPGWLRTDLGGPNAPNDPATCLPGALIPALLDDGVSGRVFRAQDYAGLSLEQALAKAASQ